MKIQGSRAAVPIPTLSPQVFYNSQKTWLTQLVGGGALLGVLVEEHQGPQHWKPLLLVREEVDEKKAGSTFCFQGRSAQKRKGGNSGVLMIWTNPRAIELA